MYVLNRIVQVTFSSTFATMAEFFGSNSWRNSSFQGKAQCRGERDLSLCLTSGLARECGCAVAN